MKLLICVVAILAAVSSSGLENVKFSDTIKATVAECAKEANFKPQPGEKPNLPALSKQPKSKCFMKCILTKEGIIDNNGDYIEAKAEAIGMPKDAIKKCSGENKQAAVCEKVYLRLKCMLKSMKNR